MKKESRKRAVCLCVAGIAFCQPISSYGAWQAYGSKWQYRQENSKEPLRSVWHEADGGWYRFDEAGFMITGWYLDIDGRWYFLNPVSDGTKGNMMTGWQWIDGYCYYLSEEGSKEHPLGSMYVNEKTPDGYETNAMGAWIGQEGQPVYRRGSGIITRPETIGGEKESRFGGSPGGVGSTRGGGGRSPGSGGTGSLGSGSQGLGKSPEKGSESPKDFKTPESSTPATSSNASKRKVNWNVYFTDSSTHQTHLAPERKGSIQEGDYLTIYFQTQITDARGRIWKSKQQSPYVTAITGPQNRTIYVEYTQEGEVEEKDSWQNEKNLLKEWLDLARKEEADFTGTPWEEIPDSRLLAADKKSCDLRLLSAASRLSRGQTQTLYLIGRNYIPEGSVLAGTYKDDVVYSHMTQQELKLDGDTYTLARFQLTRREQEQTKTEDEGDNEKRHWNIGDVQERTLNGITYHFRCIDQDYGGPGDREKGKALFLCDTVIPADTGSEYVFEKSEDGTYGYQFNPGPVVSFGTHNSYKYSHIRRWLKELEEELGEAADISTGVAYAYRGSTEPGSGSSLRSENLKSRYIGSQSMTDRLFILSIEEALKYRDWLWRFQGSEEENPESQWDTFCKSYWLRTPGDKEDQVYVVDLVQKNLHTQTVNIPENKEDPEFAVTGSTGVRPAFAVEQY